LRKEIYMSKAFATVVLAALIALPLGACASEPPPLKTGIAPPTRIPEMPVAQRPAGEPVTVSAVPREVRRAVVADAARRLRVAPSAVVLTQAEKVAWSDASLGCPLPGMVYTQAIVDGFRITAKTVAGSLTYNTDARDRVVPCIAAQRLGGRTAAPPMMDNEPRPYPATPAAPEK
jgi:hypothetical protein